MNAMSVRSLAGMTGIAGSRISLMSRRKPHSPARARGVVATLGGRINRSSTAAAHGAGCSAKRWSRNSSAATGSVVLAAPVNRPYLELAMKLSSMSRDKLRSVAEDLLDITY
jgi:hypothetical protein